MRRWRGSIGDGTWLGFEDVDNAAEAVLGANRNSSEKLESTL